MQDNLLKNIINIVKKSNSIILEIYNKPDFNIKIKNDNSPLTEADKKASDYICQELIKIDPNIPIICEETQLPIYEERKNWSEFWLVDPLDGTKEFINKNGQFTVNIALIQHNQPVLGVVGIPCQNIIYYATKGNGAYKYDFTDDLHLKLNAVPFFKGSEINIICSRSHLNDDTKNYIEKLKKVYKVKDTVSVGSSIKFLYLCENIAQIYPRFVPTSEWDIAAADVILRECGGKIVLEDGSIMPYNKKSILNPSFVAYGNIKKK